MKLVQIIFSGLLVLSSSFAFSANIAPIEHLGASASYRANTDFIELAPADSNGVSYNKFNYFDLSGTNLKILNLNPTNPADVIVFDAPNITLSAELKLIGSRAEILFVTTNTNATISCNSCSFDGFTRITLASAKFDRAYNATLPTLGALNSSAAGNVRINHLDAPNVLILDVIANNVSVDGLINLNQRVSKDVSGGVNADKNGSYILGGGSTNLNIGALNWDYDTREVISNLTSTAPTPGVVTLGGEIQSAEVKILSTKNLNLTTKIANQVDILASASFRGEVVIPNNSTSITTLPSASYPNPYFAAHIIYISSNITITNAIDTSGSILISSAGLVNLTNEGLTAGNIEILAKENIFNSATLTADHIAASGSSIVNRGNIESKGIVTLWGSSLVSNEFGGRINADEVILVSNSLVRNGSRTPYLTNHNSVRTRITDHKPILNPSSIENGFYYITNHAVTDKTKASTTSARIHADKITIKTAAFENVNPYWTEVSYVDEFDLTPSATIRRDIANGVSISAEKELVITAREYVYNSSAILRMESEDGLLSIMGGVLNNDRYRQMNLLSKSHKEVKKILNQGNMFGAATTYTSSPTKTTELYTRSYVYSPPGRIYSAGEFYAGPYSTNTPSTVINNLSFIEVGKDAKITSTTIKQKGLEHHRIAHLIESEVASERGSGIDLSGCIGCSTANVETGKIIDVNKVLTSRELDALFSIGGKLYASKSAFDAENSSAFMEYVKQAIDYKLEQTVGNLNTTSSVVDNCVGSAGNGVWCYDQVETVVEYSVSENNEAISSGLNNEYVTNINVDVSKTTTTTEKKIMVNNKTSTTENILSENWSLFDTLNSYYEAIKQSIIDTINALKNQLGWWD